MDILNTLIIVGLINGIAFGVTIIVLSLFFEIDIYFRRWWK